MQKTDFMGEQFFGVLGNQMFYKQTQLTNRQPWIWLYVVGRFIWTIKRPHISDLIKKKNQFGLV